MTSAELIAAVEAAIGGLDGVYRTAADESDLYEAALLTVAVDAARRAGGVEMLTNDGATPAATVRFRRGPGHLWNGGFTFARVEFPQTPKRLEIHLGIMVAGASSVAHECDVALIDAMECERSRAGAVHPRRRAVVAALEAKHYAGPPGLDIGRGFLGFSGEIGPGKCALVFPGQTSASLATLIARKSPECFPEVEPGSPAAQRLRGHIDQQIRNWLA
jgi:hypothetical protein